MEEDCIAGHWGVPGLGGSDGKMCISAFLHQKTFVIVVLLLVVFLIATEVFAGGVPIQGIVFAASEHIEGEDTRGSVVSPGNELLVGDTDNE